MGAEDSPGPRQAPGGPPSPAGLAGPREPAYRRAMDWTTKQCVPCEGGVPRMAPTQVDEAIASLDGWDAQDAGTRIHKHYRFKDFREAMRFVNALADVAEAEGHHPDFTVHYSAVDVALWTHAIGGLSENDFIVAAKLDRLKEARGGGSAGAH